MSGIGSMGVYDGVSRTSSVYDVYAAESVAEGSLTALLNRVEAPFSFVPCGHEVEHGNLIEILGVKVNGVYERTCYMCGAAVVDTVARDALSSSFAEVTSTLRARSRVHFAEPEFPGSSASYRLQVKSKDPFDLTLQFIKENSDALIQAFSFSILGEYPNVTLMLCLEFDYDYEDRSNSGLIRMSSYLHACGIEAKEMSTNPGGADPYETLWLFDNAAIKMLSLLKMNQKFSIMDWNYVQDCLDGKASVEISAPRLPLVFATM